MSLAAIFAAYPARLPDGVALVGPDRKDDTSRHPRISWDPQSATHLNPKEMGVVIVRQWNIDVEIWGADLTATEKLVHAFIAATHDICTRFSYGLGSEVWRTGGTTADGCRCNMTFLLQVPVMKTEFPTVPVTGFNATHTMGESQV